MDKDKRKIESINSIEKINLITGEKMLLTAKFDGGDLLVGDFTNLFSSSSEASHRKCGSVVHLLGLVAPVHVESIQMLNYTLECIYEVLLRVKRNIIQFSVWKKIVIKALNGET